MNLGGEVSLPGFDELVDVLPSCSTGIMTDPAPQRRRLKLQAEHRRVFRISLEAEGMGFRSRVGQSGRHPKVPEIIGLDPGDPQMAGDLRVKVFGSESEEGRRIRHGAAGNAVAKG